MNRMLSPDTHALEARLAARLVSGLSARSEAVPHDITERLRAGREQALLRARAVRAVPADSAQVAGVSASGAAVLGVFGMWPRRLAQVLPLLLLVAGLLAIESWTAREQVLAVADIDAQLLTDTLPPSAYSDPGFAEYLRSAPPQ
jgi:hypothetical protein